MNISQRLRTCARHTGLDAVIELLQEAADEIDALEARAQATQAEVTDAGIEQVLALAHSYADAKLMRYGALGTKEPPDPAAAFIELRRAILALRPAAVPMTDLPEGDVTYFDGRGNAFDGYTAKLVWEILRSHGITAQTKKEKP